MVDPILRQLSGRPGEKVGAFRPAASSGVAAKRDIVMVG